MTSQALAAASAPSPVYVAARSRAHGPTAPLWHAVQPHRPVSTIADACQLTVCGSLARIGTDVPWPTPTRDVCPDCRTLAR